MTLQMLFLKSWANKNDDYQREISQLKIYKLCLTKAQLNEIEIA